MKSWEELTEGAPVSVVQRGARVPLWAHSSACAYFRGSDPDRPPCDCHAQHDLAEDDPARGPEARRRLRAVPNAEETP